MLFDLHGDPSTDEFHYLMDVWKHYMLIRGLTEEEREVFVERIGSGCHFVPRERVMDLVAGAGFDEVVQFFRGLLYGGWIARKRPA